VDSFKGFDVKEKITERIKMQRNTLEVRTANKRMR
jgi:hypothetical protein